MLQVEGCTICVFRDITVTFEQSLSVIHRHVERQQQKIEGKPCGFVLFFSYGLGVEPFLLDLKTKAESLEKKQSCLARCTQHFGLQPKKQHFNQGLLTPNPPNGNRIGCGGYLTKEPQLKGEAEISM